MRSNSENKKTWALQYFYISEDGRQLEAELEIHSTSDPDTGYISNSVFKDFAKNLGINLEEFHFKYSPVSNICEHQSDFAGRCYNLIEVVCIFTELKPGLVRTKDYPCCSSKISLCSAEMRDMVCRKQLTNYPSGFGVIDGECLLNEDVYWLLSMQRLRAQKVLFYVRDKEYTIEANPSYYPNWKGYFSKQKSGIKKALRLDNQKSLIYRDKNNDSDHY
jgi:hypothetical protein